MNLYIRLLWTLLRSWRLPNIRVGDTLERQLRVLPNDLDVNLHMNNGRYMTLVDLLLIEYFVRIGYAKVLFSQGWRPMSGGAIITYRRGLEPFQRYTLRFSLVASTDIWNYMRFEFVANGKVFALGYMKGAAVSKNGLVSNQQSFDLLGLPLPVANVPLAVQQWIDAEASLMAEIRPTLP